MAGFPDLADAAVFRTFFECPMEDGAGDGSAPATSPPSPQHEPTTGDAWCLLAQVKENMTITKPTLVVMDRAGVDFALTFEDRHIDVRPFKKGSVVAVPQARRTAPDGEGRKGFVRVPPGDGGSVTGVPASLEVVLRLGAAHSPGRPTACDNCGLVGHGADGPALKKCTRCGVAQYCGKSCQATAWQEKGHKSDCKVLKAMAEIRSPRN